MVQAWFASVLCNEPRSLHSLGHLLKNLKFKSLFKKIEKNGEIERNFFNKPSGELKLNHYLVQHSFDKMIQFGLISKCG